MKKPVFILFTVVMCLILGIVPALAQGETECEEGYRLFDHEYLATDPVCIPEDPQRFIALDMPSLELLLYLDKDIVGSTTWVLDQYKATLPELADRLEGVVDVGFPVDLELALELQPDMILSYDALEGIIDYDLGSEIAPIVSTSLIIDDWERATEFWAEVLNAGPLFEEMKATYDARITELQSALEVDPAETEVSLVTANQYGASIWLLDTPQAKILADVGFARPESQQYDGEEAVAAFGTRQTASISDETLNLADGDIIYIYSYSTLDPELLATEDQAIVNFRESPIWQSLNGVAAGQDYVVGAHWFRAGTYLMANAVIDDLFATLTDTEPTIANPLTVFPQVAAHLEAADTATTEITCEEGFRYFDNEVLVSDPTCIPENPQRIAYLLYASYLYPFGIEPAGTWGFERDAANFPVIADWILGLEDVQDIGLPPNLESLTAVHPDLMILADTRVTEIIDELPMIAPTLVYEEGADWRARHRFLGEVFNQSDVAEAQLATVDERIEELREAINEKYGDIGEITVSLVRIFGTGDYFLANERYVSVQLLTEIGFKIPEAVHTMDGWGVNFTDESIQIANADVTLLIGSAGGATNQNIEGQALVTELMQDPLWNTLDSFQAEQVYVVGDDFQQSSLMAAHQILDALVNIFDVEIETANPFLPDQT
ncbi:ABC transporter substrate-binding protein [Phototrophicus methaneseepsis]|uniref:ABC transporter substrate-binding protein n=1 Tax=Phototrophicus methaneseepsis TaxID=2710758 RepID=A0A7S8IF98_9CHLR|nr:ABC transporter substrate-binding protein [Phototrophicus methaneseepsis]QPC83279.1 ABC transporter substrate-binding protein [Phototrophicus methaneseepsis]